MHELQYRLLRFAVHPTEFVIHRSHNPSTSRKQWKSNDASDLSPQWQATVVGKVYRRFLKEVASMDPTQPPSVLANLNWPIKRLDDDATTESSSSVRQFLFQIYSSSLDEFL
jgi:hypothetical protein